MKDFVNCKLCITEDPETWDGCPEKHNGYECTKEKGHSGDHAACGIGEGEHPICTWGEEKQDET